MRHTLNATPKVMTPEWIAAQVACIKEAAGDDEVAHSMEDALHIAVLESISDGQCDFPQKCAATALQTSLLSFARWCA